MYVQGFGCSFAGERILSIDKLTYEFYITCFASPALHTKVHIGSSSYANWVSMLSGQITSVFNDTSCKLCTQMYILMG